MYDSYSTLTWQSMLQLVNFWLMMRHYTTWDMKIFEWCWLPKHIQKCTICCQTIIWKWSFHINARIDNLLELINHLVTQNKTQVNLKQTFQLSYLIQSGQSQYGLCCQLELTRHLKLTTKQLTYLTFLPHWAKWFFSPVANIERQL